MKESKPKRRQRGRRIRRPFLATLLLVCLAGAGYLGYLGFTEYMERKRGNEYYVQLAADVYAYPDTYKIVDNVNADMSQRVLTNTSVPAIVPQESEIDFEVLREKCPDIVAWIRIEDSMIDYPVVLGDDNDFYLHHLPDKTANQAGSIMMDQSNSGDFSEMITILHGHHMRNGSMFGRLEDYREKDYYLSHPMIHLYTPAGDYDVAVFAAYTVNGYTFGYPTFFEDQSAFEVFIRRAMSAAAYETDVEVEYGDRLLLLSTCSYAYTGERFVVLGKIIETEEGARQ